MKNGQKIIERLDAIEEHLISVYELKSLGHRIVYDVKTGESTNINGLFIEPKKLNKEGYRVRL